MTHEEIEGRDLADAYVMGRLSKAERDAFEDHCYACDACFEQVEITQRFVEGARHVLPRRSGQAGAGWLMPAFSLACAASVALAVLAGWAVLLERPRLLAQLEDNRRGPVVEVAKATPPTAEPNQPLLMLEASRDTGKPVLVVPAASSRIVLWAEPPPAAAGAVYRMEIAGEPGAPAQVIDGLVRNAYGALAASVPAGNLAPGSYRVRLLRDGTLAGEYLFTLRR